MADNPSAKSSAANGGQRPPRYEGWWRAKFHAIGPDGAFDLADMARRLRAAAERLDEMRRDGVTLEPAYDEHDRRIASGQDDYYTLATDNPAIAEKYGFEDAEDDHS
jgi:hypothetical protein